MSRTRERIFPIFEEVCRVLAPLSDEQLGKTIRYVLGSYFGVEVQFEPDVAIMVSVNMLLDQAARYDSYRDQQRNNSLRIKGNDTPIAPKGSQVQPTTPPCPSPNPDPLNDICAVAVQTLNDLSGSSFRATSKTIQRVIAARIKEGYTLEDIVTVIKHQYHLWYNDPKMRSYLRPSTLFGDKMECYLSDAKRDKRDHEHNYILAPIVDPFELAVKEEHYD